MAAPTKQDEQEALRLKSLADSNFASSTDLNAAFNYAKRAHRLAPNLPGVTETLAALTVLRAAASKNSPFPDWYAVLGVEPFAPASVLRKRYKQLALLLHPDKSPYVASDEAFKLVAEAFRLLSDRAWKRDYDVKLRLRILDEKEKENVGEEDRDTFWTACSTCRLLHQFERKYLGHNLVCPSCRKSFKAVEVGSDDDGSEEEEEEKEEEEEEEAERARKGSVGKLKSKEVVDDDERLGDFVSRRKAKSVKGKMGVEKDGGLRRSQGLKGGSEGGKVRNEDSESKGEGVAGSLRSGDLRTRTKGKVGIEKGGGLMKSRCLTGGVESNEVGNKVLESEREGIGGSLRIGDLRKRKRGEVLDTSKPKRVKTGEEMMTLAEFQSEVKRTARQKMKLKLKENGEDHETERRSERRERLGELKNNKDLEAGECRSMKKSVKPLVKGMKEDSLKKKEVRPEKHGDSGGRDLETFTVVDSDFYDFDKDRTHRSFRKGQMWAVYDDIDGMPRHYALIDEVFSANPFQVSISWFDLQNNGVEKIISCEKMGFHMPCGRFKITQKASINSVNVFSHVVDCDRAAREVYQVYPKKGSVWALYGKATLDADEQNFAAKGKRCYDIVVFLTSYSEISGLSMAYLEKVDGYKTVFKRQERGSHAIRFLGKDDLWLISHQIPARKLSCNDTPELLKDCWELDPASLPSDLLTIGGIDN
ncbi:uncharacterized protein LOC107487158 [Arachis duranensis]|uniref:Uncharacterized protein LOC107487158 n=1 Tax=Arachis duranensis TaxID=130453 RepID=A0A6P4DDF5_ARADU|nr:uncharacterized protein LOC107487158 [Arachis duranensis]